MFKNLKILFLSILLATFIIPSFASAQMTANLTDDVSISDTACLDLQYNMGYRSRDTKTNGEVTELQSFLNDENYLSVEPTGYYGLATVQAVKNFQTATLGATSATPGYGKVGPKSRATIKELTCGGTTVTPLPIIPTTSVSFSKTAGMTDFTVSPNTSNVKIGSFTVNTGTKDGILINKIKVNLTTNNIYNINNLSVRLGSTFIGTPIGTPVSNDNTFMFSSTTVSINQSKTFDVYADIGSASSFSVRADMSINYMSQSTGITDISPYIMGVGVASQSATLVSPTLSPISPVSQFVVGGSTMNIATFKLKTAQVGTSATVRELRFTTTGMDAIESITVGGVTSANVGFGNTVVSGLNIPIDSYGTDVPVTVKFTKVGSGQGYLPSGVSDVGVTLTKVQATTGASVVTVSAPVSSNNMTLVASKPTVTMSSGNTSPLILGAENKIGEFTVTANSGGSISLSKISLFSQMSAILNPLLSNTRIYNGNENMPASVEQSGLNSYISFNTPYEISAGTSATFSIYSKLSGVRESGFTPTLYSSLPSDYFYWNDIIGGNTQYTGKNILNFPTNSYTTVEGSIKVSSVPTVEFIGTPTLSLQYGSAGKESVLVGSATVKITAGGSPINIGYSQGNAHIARLLQFASTEGKNAYTNSAQFTASSNPSCVFTATAGCLIPANTSMTFEIRNTVKTSEMFAGTYSMILGPLTYFDSNNNSQTIQTQNFKGVTTSNSKTVIGEISPYINNIVCDSAININCSINGIRFNSTSNVISLNSKTIAVDSLSNGTMINFRLSDFGITQAGNYIVKVSTNNGASNNYNLSVINLPVMNNVLPTMTVSSKDCVVPVNANTCSVSVSWNNPSAKYLNVYNQTKNFNHFYTSETSGTRTVAMTRISGESQILQFRDGATLDSVTGATVLDSILISVRCADGSVFDGSKCASSVVSSAPTITDVTGAQSSYAPNSQLSIQIKGVLGDGIPASSGKGYNVQAYIYPVSDTTFNSYLPSNPPHSYNGTYNEASGYWDVQMNTPLTPGSYNLRVSLYCGLFVAGGCNTDNPQSNARVLPFNVTAPTTPVSIPYVFNGITSTNLLTPKCGCDASVNIAECPTTYQSSTDLGNVCYDQYQYKPYGYFGGSVTATRTFIKNGSAPAVAPTLTLSANPTTVAYGGQTTLTWSATNALNCNWTEGDVQFKNYENTLSGTNRYTQSLNATQNYTLYCMGANGVPVAKSVTIGVTAPTTPAPVVTLTSSATSVTSGGSATINWSVQNAPVNTYCTLTTGSIDDYAAGSAPLSGSKTLSNLTSPRTVTFSCSDATPKSVTIGVTAPTTYTLTVSKSGTGTGVVASYPTGISCGNTCSMTSPQNTTVTLAAGVVVGSGSVFTGWSGDCSGNATTCFVSMSSDKNVTANFSAPTTTSYKPSTVKQYVVGGVAFDISAPATCKTLVPISRGSWDTNSNGSVSALQKFLANKYNLNTNEIVTGFYGDKTKELVTRFQTENGLEAVGYVGNATRELIKNQCTN